MRIQNKHITTGALIAGAITAIYASQAEAFNLGAFGIKGAVSVQDSKQQSSTYRMNQPTVAREQLGAIDGFKVFKELDSGDIKQAKIIFTPNDGGQAIETLIDANTVLAIVNDMLVGFDQMNQKFVLFQKDREIDDQFRFSVFNPVGTVNPMTPGNIGGTVNPMTPRGTVNPM